MKQANELSTNKKERHRNIPVLL